MQDAGLAYTAIYNRAGRLVSSAADLEFEGLNRFCSAQLIPAQQFGQGIGLTDPIFFAGEETDGGSEFALDIATQQLWAVPWLGRAAWESVTELNTGSTNQIALLIGDDRGGAPLLLYVGQKNARGDGSFLDRNGLAKGQLYAWVADSGETTPEEFKGTFANRSGRFVEIDYYRPDLSSADGFTGYDALGFATQDKQDELAFQVAGAFHFSRPEDVATNPADGTVAVLASTGRDSLYPSDSWGTTYKINVDFSNLENIKAGVKILYSGDDAGSGQFQGPDFGLRSPDNLEWSADGYIYVQEDRSVNGFGRTSGEEASIWKLDPNSGALTRIAQINRTTGVPDGQTDNAIGDIGNWESSGIIDVSALFGKNPGELFLFNVQAHSLQDGIIKQADLVQGGQIGFLSRPAKLTGFASLPADTFADGPLTGTGISANGRTGPFSGPPIQGFSGVQFAPDGDGSNFWFLSDNGFGAKTNSADYLLRIYQVDPSLAGSEGGDGSVAIQRFIQLRDPDGLIPFSIQNQNSPERLLTGADFDIESFVIDGNGEIWVGEEFGPYILHFDATGKLLDAPIPTPNFSTLNTLKGQDPLVIGHRGASGSRPEHTLEAYKLAIEQGADFIEPDLVVTKDGVLVARHENEISGTSDVADRPEFADRRTTKVIDGTEFTGWFAEDFTLAELKTLRAKERIPNVRPGNTAFDGQFEIPTLAEVIDLVKQVEAETGKRIGIYPETKHPTFLAKEGTFLDGTPINLDSSQILVDTLIAKGFTDPSRIFIQSFEMQNLIEIQARLNAEGLGDIPLVQLYGDTTKGADQTDAFSFPYDIRYNVAQGYNLQAIYGADFLAAAEKPLSDKTVYADLDSPSFLQLIADRYAEGVGPWKNNILLRRSLTTPVDGNGDGVAEISTQLTGEVTSFIKDAHRAGLQVHPYTHRNEERYLTLNVDGTPQTPASELAQLISLGVDGFFTDFPATGDQVRDQVVADWVRSPDHPAVLAGNGVANLGRSKGFEGMAFSPDRATLYPLLEGTVVGDPAGSLRIYKFDVARAAYTGLVGFYQMEASGNAIGDFTPINSREFLVIERDNGQGASAKFKKIFKVDLGAVNSAGFVSKEEVVDLMTLQDPLDLNRDGRTTFDFPFVTIENLLVIDADTILVANDNNYPFSLGRGPDIDNNEVIEIELTTPLNLDPRLGAAGFVSSSQPLIDLRDITGMSKLTFTVNRDAVLDNFVGFYPVVNSNGGLDTNGDGVADLNPGDSDYRAAALKAFTEVGLVTPNRTESVITSELAGGKLYAPLMVVNGTAANYQDKTVLFAFAAANPDGMNHVRMVNGRMGFEDLLGTSSDGDFNDLVIGFDIA